MSATETKKPLDTFVLKDRNYKLLIAKPPLSYTIATRNTDVVPLMWFDEEKQTQRALRYAINYPTPFEDEQKDNAIVPMVEFIDGGLFVPKENTALQKLLAIHPHDGIVFAEVDVENDAQSEIDKVEMEIEAMNTAKNLSVSQQEGMCRVIFGKNPDTLTSAVLKREILRYAQKNPQEFLRYYSDPEISYESQIRGYFDKKLLGFRNGQKDVYFNTSGNKSRMLVVPQGHNPFKVVGDYLRTDDGLTHLKALEAESEAT